MNTIQPLIILLGEAERERDGALADCQRAQTAHQAAQTQAEQLRGYRREYEQRWGSQFAQEGKIELVRCYQGFVDRLTQAVEQQEHVQRHAAAALERERAALRELEMRVAAVRKLIERRVHEQRAVDDRHEQKQTDELAARSAWNRLQGSGAQHVL